MSRLLDPDRLVVHLDRMYRAARAMCGSTQEAEDLVQDTCVRLLTKQRRIHDDDELGYLLTALRNTHINRRRAAARRPQPADAPELPLPDERDDVSTHERVRAREVMAWIQALPDELSQAIVAVDIVGLPRANAARELDVTERMLGERLARARLAIAAKLEPVPAGCP